MSDLEKRKKAFVGLGAFLRDFSLVDTATDQEMPLSTYAGQLRQAIQKAEHINGWFTEDQVLFALHSLGALLSESALDQWLSAYKESIEKKEESKRVAVIMAGNIPLVGFHDFLSVLISGHTLVGKLSSDDPDLLPVLANVLIAIEPSFRDRIYFVNEKLHDFDAVIATGGDNSARHFEYYFGKYPHIIRKNRNTMAVLTGEESEASLEALGEDIFRYFGLGCRSVSKLFVPEGYDFDGLFKALYSYKDVIQNARYARNYEYNRAVYLMNLDPILDNNFLLLKEDKSYSSPVAVLFYEYYKDLGTLKEKLVADSEKLQCVVADSAFAEGVLKPGAAQKPGLSDYADGVDTMAFLLSL